MWRGDLVALALLAGCHSVLGVEDLPRRTGPDPVAYALAPCESCVAKTCAPLRDRCLRDVTCDAVLRCAAKVPLNRPDLRAECERKGIGGAAPRAFLDYDDCTRKSCLDTCIGDRGLAASIDRDCACLDDACASESAACIAAPDATSNLGACERTHMCILHGGLTPDSTMGCYAQSPNDNHFDAFRACWVGKTCNSCKLATGNVFACSGAYKWREAVAPEVKFAGNVLSITRKKIGGVTVRACLAGCDCDGAPETVADAEGHFALSLDTKRKYACIEISGPGVRTTEVYLGRPLQRDETNQELLAAAEGDLEALAIAVPELLSEERGHMVVVSLDCVFTRARGVEVTLDRNEGARRVYVSATGVDAMASTTFARGVTIFLNTVVGANVIRIKHEGREVSAFPVVANAGHVILIGQLPSPQ